MEAFRSSIVLKDISANSIEIYRVCIVIGRQIFIVFEYRHGNGRVIGIVKKILLEDFTTHIQFGIIISYTGDLPQPK